MLHNKHRLPRLPHAPLNKAGTSAVAGLPPTLYWHTAGLGGPRKDSASTSFFYKLDATPAGGQDGRAAVECAFADWRQSGIMGSPPAAGGVKMRLRGCELIWDAKAAAAARGKDFYVQVLVRPARNGAGSGGGGSAVGGGGPHAQSTLDFVVAVI